MRPRISRPIGTYQKILFAGFGLSCLSYKYLKIAKCEANITGDRLTGFKYSDKEIKFDWRRFWIYLKPHLLKLAIAIIVSLIYGDLHGFDVVHIHLFSGSISCCILQY